MKVAILTLPLHTNYGGIVQAYALQTMLVRFGHEVEVLQKIEGKQDESLFYKLPLYGRRIARKILKDWSTPILLEKRLKLERPIIRQNTNKFINQYIREVTSLRDIQSTDYDVIVVGSDQIWRKPYFKGMWRTGIKDAFLDFTKDWKIKRIAYAASFGMDNISEYSKKEISECLKAVQAFSMVSVRELSGLNICTEKLGRDASHLLDPTMLLDKQDYVSLIENSDVARSAGNLFCYILNPDEYKSDVISKLSKGFNLTPFSVNAPVNNHGVSINNRIQPPVEQWLRGFMDAELVITDSFHACVFSIIFGKPFMAIGNKYRGMGRFTSLLKTFGLEKCLMSENMEIISQLPQIDWNTVNSRLSRLKERSISFLQSI